MDSEKVSIRQTVESQAQRLSEIQKAAFYPLYEKYHDAGNPYLRGAEDILKRFNRNFRYFTILYDGEIVGGIVYRLHGKRVSATPGGAELKPGEYYLLRVYILPQYQSRGIARRAILLCEAEFPDAEVFYVDFPEDLDKNRKCYQNAGFHDTGERICIDGAPTLAMFEKRVR